MEAWEEQEGEEDGEDRRKVPHSFRHTYIDCLVGLAFLCSVLVTHSEVFQAVYTYGFPISHTLNPDPIVSSDVSAFLILREASCCCVNHAQTLLAVIQAPMAESSVHTLICISVVGCFSSQGKHHTHDRTRSLFSTIIVVEIFASHIP